MRKPPFAAVVATASTTHLPERLASTRTFCPAAAGVSTPVMAAAPPYGAGCDGVASVTAPGPIASTWLVAVVVVPSGAVSVSVTVYEPAFAYVCLTVAPVPVVPSPKFQASIDPGAGVAFIVIVSGAPPFRVVNAAVEWTASASATPPSAGMRARAG